jgi:transposase
MVDAPLSPAELASLQAAGLGELGARLLKQLTHAQHEITWRDASIEKLTFEMAQLKRVKFGVKSEQLDAQQKALFDEAVDADIAALEEQLQDLIAGSSKSSEPRTSASSGTTSPRTPPARAAVRSSASART